MILRTFSAALCLAMLLPAAAGAARLEFTAELQQADSGVDAPSTVSGFVEFQEPSPDVSHSPDWGEVRYGLFERTTLSLPSETHTFAFGLVMQLHDGAILFQAGEIGLQTFDGRERAVQEISGATPSSFDPATTADDIDGNGYAGTTRVLADLDGDGVIDPDEVIALRNDFGDLPTLDLTPIVSNPSITISLALEPTGQGLAYLSTTAGHELTLHYGPDGLGWAAPGRPGDAFRDQATYRFTSLAIVPEPACAALLAAAIGLVGAGARRRRPSGGTHGGSAI
ncbi:hypothetical protein Mal64_16890 [Pseudobythopirellula maris]|uniref:EF-hand domain-containing protein n=1 Tax=Pseudobythopirellula maris TaxID=2527991 RepID=A0A5C5ZM38_9BACT|nr:hypothetical protein [Pseudobythopirellula maris]TWT88210.1 hypothetical protein Mal64_16890 [Pseudobythopirellula maris]